MKRMQELGDKYDGIYNGHHDFRALGAPLDDDCLPTVIAMMEDALAGHIVDCQVPSPWGQDLQLTSEPVNVMAQAPGMIAGTMETRPRRVMLRRGRNFLAINPDNLYEKKD